MKWLRRILLTKLSIFTLSVVGLASYGGWKTYSYYEPFLAETHLHHNGALEECLLNKSRFVPPADSSLTEYQVLFLTGLLERLNTNLRESAATIREADITSGRKALAVAARLDASQRAILITELNRAYISVGEYSWIRGKLLVSLGIDNASQQTVMLRSWALTPKLAHFVRADKSVPAEAAPVLTGKDRRIFADHGNFFASNIFPLVSRLDEGKLSRQFGADDKDQIVQF